MRHSVFSSTTVMPVSSPSSSSSSAKSKSSHSNPSSVVCKHSPSAAATLDVLILVVVLFSGSFLVTSYFAYIFNSLSLLLSAAPLSLHLSLEIHLPHLLGFLAFFLLAAAAVLAGDLCCGARSRRCDRPGCRGLRKAMEFDLKLQSEDSVRSSSSSSSAAAGSGDIDRLPWKGGSESNPDYDCLRSELRKMAPPNGRAVLLFRARCGCPVAKLEGWGPKRGGRRSKKFSRDLDHAYRMLLNCYIKESILIFIRVKESDLMKLLAFQVFVISIGDLL